MSSDSDTGRELSDGGRGMFGPDMVRRREDAWVGGTLNPSISYTSR